MQRKNIQTLRAARTLGGTNRYPKPEIWSRLFEIRNDDLRRKVL